MDLPFAIKVPFLLWGKERRQPGPTPAREKALLSTVHTRVAFGSMALGAYTRMIGRALLGKLVALFSADVGKGPFRRHPQA
jgi:hypothetical protein